jgi:hypothetical protein
LNCVKICILGYLKKRKKIRKEKYSIRAQYELFLSSSFELRCEKTFLNQSSNPQQQTVSCTSGNRALVDSKISLQGTKKENKKNKKGKEK